MKKFILNTCLFVLAVCFASCIVVFISGYRDRKISMADNDAIFVWGDSQMYQGLDIEQLSDSLGQKVYSSACHGAGVYDFLVFVDKVPDSSKVIISFPECALYRNPSHDNNRSGVNVYAMRTLFKSEYGLKEVFEIAKLNHYCKTDIFTSNTPWLYEYADSIILAEPLDGFVRMFSNTDEYILHKHNAYLKGVESLSKKGCSLCLISFPFDESLECLIQESPCREKSDSLAAYLKKEYCLADMQVTLPSDSLMMHDLSHMNELGARKFTKELSEMFLNTEGSFFDLQLL